MTLGLNWYPNSSTFEIIRSDIERINRLQISGIYRINFVNNEANEDSYISLTKRKIDDRIKKHERDLKLNKSSTEIINLH